MTEYVKASDINHNTASDATTTASDVSMPQINKTYSEPMPVCATPSLQLAMNLDRFLENCGSIQRQASASFVEKTTSMGGSLHVSNNYGTDINIRNLPIFAGGNVRQRWNIPLTKPQRRLLQDEKNRKVYMPTPNFPKGIERSGLSITARDFGFKQYSAKHDVIALYEGTILSELAESVKLPLTIQRNTWFANQFIKIYKEVNMVSSLLLQSGCCTEESCPKMRAMTHNYLWQDSESSEQKALSAPHYIRLVLANAQAILNDPRVFPKSDGDKFPEKFEQILAPMFRRFFRVYAHIYRHHLNNLDDMGNSVELRVRFCFCHCWFFIREFGLVPDVELDTVRPLLDQWAKEAGFDISNKSKESNVPSSEKFQDAMEQ